MDSSLQRSQVMERPTTWDITQFIDLANRGRLDLEPSYQRRSVWGPKDRREFLNTIFMDYPSPPIFLHKRIDENGNAFYDVVDGKQRLTTILDYANNKIKLGEEYIDSRLDGLKFRDLDTDMKHIFWNHPLQVINITTNKHDTLNEVFERLNKNFVKLTRQELRHARYSGWFIAFVESEPESEKGLEIWKALGLLSRARRKRMRDIQFLSELLLVVITKMVQGFDQDRLDEICSEYDEIEYTLDEVNVEIFVQEFRQARDQFGILEKEYHLFSTTSHLTKDLYTFWNVLILNQSNLPTTELLAERYLRFMSDVGEVVLPEKDEHETDETSETESEPLTWEDCVISYALNNIGATTELPQRTARYVALRPVLVGDFSV